MVKKQLTSHPQLSTDDQNTQTLTREHKHQPLPATASRGVGQEASYIAGWLAGQIGGEAMTSS